MHPANYLRILRNAELDLADGFRQVADAHAADPDVYHLCHTFASQCEGHAEELEPSIDRYGAKTTEEPERVHPDIFREPRQGGIRLYKTYKTCTSWPASAGSAGP